MTGIIYLGRGTNKDRIGRGEIGWSCFGKMKKRKRGKEAKGSKGERKGAR